MRKEYHGSEVPSHRIHQGAHDMHVVAPGPEPSPLGKGGDSPFPVLWEQVTKFKPFSKVELSTTSCKGFYLQIVLFIDLFQNWGLFSGLTSGLFSG